MVHQIDREGRAETRWIKMKYTRLYADSDGETHFEDLDEEFQQSQMASNVPSVGLTTPIPATDIFFLRANPDYSDDYRVIPRRFMVKIVSGEMNTAASDGEVRQFGPGDVFLCEDVTGNGHMNQVVSKSDCVMMMVGLAD